MATFWRVFRFEIGRDLRRRGLWLGTALFFGLGVGWILLLAGVGEMAGLTVTLGGGEKLFLNSPFMNHAWTSALTFFGVILTASLFGNAASYEYLHRMTPLLWTTGLTRAGAWWGRFAAALVANLVVLSGVGVGLWVGSLLPWLDRSLFGPTTFYSYVSPYLLTVLPRTLLPAVLIYLLVSKTRSTLSGYLAAVGMIVFFIVSGLLLNQIENRTLAALLDPTGNTSWGLVTRTWSTAEKNHLTVPWTGLVLANRLLWAGVSLVLLFVGRLIYKPERGALGSAPLSIGRLWRELVQEIRDNNRLPALLRPLTSRLPLTLRLAFSEYRSVVFHVGFLVSMAMMVFLCFLVIILAGSTLGGTPSWPVTYYVANVLSGVVGPFILGLLLAFSGFLVWRERSQRVDGILDSLPRSHWQPFVSKFVALALVAVTIEAVGIFCGLVYQTFQGYFRYQLGVWVGTFLGFRLVEALLLLALAFLLQTLLPRYAAYLVSALLYIGINSAPGGGLDHLLYLYGADPGLQYSELNGWRPFLTGWFTTKAYWGTIALLLLVATGLLWQRGVDTAFAVRLRHAARRATPAVRAAVAVLALAAIGLGGWIFYNTNVLNHYVRPSTAEKMSAALERKYRPRMNETRPQITDTDLAVDLYPGERRAHARGTYRLQNKSDRPIADFLLSVNPDLTVKKLEFARPATVAPAGEGGDPYRQVRFAQPLTPGEETALQFDLELVGRGFANRQQMLGAVLPNGTFINSGGLLPGFGYEPGAEVGDPRRRKKLGLPARDPLPPMDIPGGRDHTIFAFDSDRIPFHAVMSTSGDQVAFAPGDLVRQWSEGGRRFFEYRSARPIFKFYAFVSGRYSVLRGKQDGVDVEIYYHPPHKYNVATMMRAARVTLASMSAHFGAYPNKTLRIVEFPRYASFAQSFPTLVPFSEEIGWIARRKKPEDIDYPLYVTAHEVAHQWWGHQVTGARVQGATFLIETLAQDSALRIMEEQLGKPVMGRFLRYELDRYLTGRSAAVREEVPLLQVMPAQQFLHYNKGSLVMYNLASLIGRDQVNAALAGLAGQYSFNGPPYPISRDLYTLLQAKTPPELKTTATDLFERITLFDLETTKATCKPLPGGKYKVSFDVKLSKGYADGEGNLKPAPLDDRIDVAVLAEAETPQGKVPKPLVLENRELRAATGHFDFTVNEKPVRAGLDPYFKIVDRQPENNTQKLSCGGGVMGMMGR